ncbi:MAG TPA: hypothetical protein VMS17_22475 [Gemmataceae bacterium]|nr:hypothetical protein [Gemmataceae bacterium]
MMRAFLCSAALLGLGSVCLAADAKDAKNDNGMTATVFKVDAKNNTVSLRWKDKDGKDQTQTVELGKDVQLTDENGKAVNAEALKEGQQVRVTENNGKVTALQLQKAGPANNPAFEATITNVDAKKGTITVKMKDKDGKDVEKMFALTEDARFFDSTGKVAALDVFRSGNDVLIVEEEGKLKQIQQKGPEKKEPGK